MYNCEKCLHEEMCDQPGRQLWGHLNKENDCSDFKDRTKYVEVVRCKDCKMACVVIPPLVKEESLVCTKAINWRTVEQEHFCSYGVRKDN